MSYLSLILIDRKITSTAVCYILLLISCCSSLFSISAFASNLDTTEKVTLHLRWHHQFQFAGYYAAIEKGFYAEEGLDVALREIKRDTGMIKPVIDGTADYGVADGSLLAARANGVPVVVLAQIFQHSPQVFLSLRETGIYTPHDIRGKKAMFDASNASLNLLFFETLGGTDSFEIVPQSYNLNDLIAGNVQLVSAYLANEPYQLRKRGIEFNILHPRGYGIDYFGDNLFTNETELRNNPQRVQKMTRATLKGWQYALKNKNEIINLIINRYSPNADREKLVYEAQVTEQMILPDLIPLGHIDLLRYKEIARGYARLGLIDSAEIPQGLFLKPEKKNLINLSDKEKNWIAEHPVITLGTNRNWEPFVIEDNNGTISGLEADLIQRINEIAGTNIQIVLGKWTTIIEEAKSGKIDGLLVSTAQEKRAPYFLFSDSLYNAYKYIFTTALKIYSMGDLKGKRVAYQRGILIHENFLNTIPGIIPVPAESINSLALLLNNNQVDAALGGHLLKFYLQERLFPGENQVYIVPGSKEAVLYSIRKDWPEFLSIINKAIAQISPKEVASIREKWFISDKPEGMDQVSLSKKERAWLKAHPSITFTAPDNFEPYIISNPGGTMSGMLVDFLAELNRRLGTGIKLSTGTLKENLPKVKSGEEDGILALHPDYADALGLLKTRTYITAYPALFARKGLVLNSPADLAGKKIVHREAEYFSGKIIDQYGQNAKRLTVDNGLDGLRMVNRGDADVFVGLSGATYLINKYQLSGLSPKHVFFDSPLQVGLAVQPGLPELVPILNKGLSSFSEDYINTLSAKWIQLPEPKPRVQLSIAEQTWLEKGRTIQVRITDFPPYIIPQKDGPPKGIAIDSLKLIAERTGVKFNFVSSGKTFREALEGIKNHQGPDVIATIVSTHERQKSILFTRVFTRSPLMIFMRTDTKKITAGMSDLIGKKVALLKGGALKEMVKKEFPEIKQALFDTHIQAIDAVANKDAEAYIGNLTLTSYHLLQSGYYNLRLAAPSPFGDQVLSMGVRNDWPELARIIDKGLASITPEEQAGIRNRYISLHFDKSNTSEYVKWILIVAGSALGIVLLFFFWNRGLSRQVAARTAELKESEIKYRNVLESTSTVPWEIDLNSGVFTFMGNQIEKILGYPAESWKDIAVWAERVHPEDRDGAVRFCETETKKGQDHDFVYRSVHTDGSYRWIRDVVSVVKGETGPETLVGFMHDITEQKELALEREQLQKQWEQSQKLEAIGTLAGGIAHDFNNILSVILGFTDLAKESSPVDSSISDDLEEVLTAAHRAKELVQQILAFSRQSLISPVPLAPELIVQEALKMLRSSIPTTIQIRENIFQGCGTVIADPTQIHQIMMNLCTNAFHAMEENGGTMTVELKRADFIPPDLAESTFGFVELSVSDTGKGIDHEIMDKIFDPFFTTKEQGKGTGMGLSIIYGIVKEHGGSVTVESELEKGTTFHVYLPRFEKTPDPAEVTGTDIPEGKERILFVDDEHNITKMAKAMLEKIGYTVTVKMDSFEALETFQNQPDAFDLVITDQTMPGMTGLNLSKKMMQKRSEIPIILCSGYSSIVNEEIAKTQGIREFLSKPYTKDTMHALIRKVLDTRRTG